MNMFDKINSEIKTAMKAHDNLRRDCLRAVVSEIKNQTVNAGKEITDSVCLKVLQKAVKSHNDSITQFAAAGRIDLADKEKAELDVISAFLPKVFTAEETELKVKDIIDQLEGQFGRKMEKKDMGMVMKTVTTCREAQSFDMKAASAAVKKILGL